MDLFDTTTFFFFFFFFFFYEDSLLSVNIGTFVLTDFDLSYSQTCESHISNNNVIFYFYSCWSTFISLTHIILSGLGGSDARLTCDQEVAGSIPTGCGNIIS